MSGRIAVRLSDDPESFLAFAGSFFAAEPLTGNVIAVEVEGVVGGQRPLRAGSLWITAENDRRLVGIAMHTPPFNLFLPRLADEVSDAVAEALFESGRQLPGVNGERGTAERFLSRWTRLTNSSAYPERSMRLYLLGKLAPPSGVAGEGRTAVPAEQGLVSRWLGAFHHEADPNGPAEDFDSVAERRVAQGLVWMWRDKGEPVSLAGISRPAAGVARVGPVYTPPESRGHGYGSAVTALASQSGLDAGATHVVLYTDLSNPTSNSIYQTIGYMPDHDSGRWSLGPA
jgi:GNAT superfamily N-acetyltransferase